MARRSVAPSRATILVGRPGSSQPSVVLKTGFLDENPDFLRREHRALNAIRGALPDGFRASVPVPLGIEQVGQLLVHSTAGVGGRSPAVPRGGSQRSVLRAILLRRYLASVVNWSRSLELHTSQSTSADESSLVDLVDRFSHLAGREGGSLASLSAFRRILQEAHISFRPCWQHGDMAPGNILINRNNVVVLDWEFARSDYEPWFDVGYALLGIALQTDDPASALRIDDALISKITRGSAIAHGWPWPLPPSWAFTLVSMRAALERSSAGREQYVRWGEAALDLTDGCLSPRLTTLESA